MPVLFSDDFTGPAGQTLGTRAGWAFIGGSGGAIEVNGANQLRNTNTLAAGIAYVTPDFGTPDHWVKWRFLTDNCLPFVCIRLLNNQTWGAGVRMDAGSLVAWQRNGGTYTLLQNFGPVANFSTADEWELRPNGTSAQIFRNGAAYGSPFTLNIQLTRTFGGLFGRTAAVNPWVDDVSYGDLVAGSAWDLTGTLLAEPAQMTGAGSHDRPAHAASATLVAAAGQMTGAGAHAPPAGASLSGAMVAAPAQIAGAASHSRPAHAASATLVAAAGQMTGAGAHAPPAGASLSGAMVAAPAQMTCAGSHAPPAGVSLSGVLVAAPAQMAGAASHTRPAHALSGTMVAAPAQMTGAGAHAGAVPTLSGVLVAAPAQMTAAASHAAPVVAPGGGAPVVAALSIARLLDLQARLLPLLSLTMEMDGKPMTTTLRPIAGEEMELRLRVRTPAGAVVAAGGIAITAKPPGGQPVRFYGAVAAGIGEWTATVLFDVPGRWWISGACQTPSRAIAEFPVEVQPRAVS